MKNSESTGSTESKRRMRKERQGVVIGANAQKTVVVSVVRGVMHSKYGKYMRVRRKYAVHDTLGCQVGDQVRIEETRPISKTKRWRVLEKISKST